ncbi:hypothetical protein BVRB_036130, partial [Beta vulgaris subsp. vulgaris]
RPRPHHPLGPRVVRSLLPTFRKLRAVVAAVLPHRESGTPFACVPAESGRDRDYSVEAAPGLLSGHVPGKAPVPVAGQPVRRHPDSDSRVRAAPSKRGLSATDAATKAQLWFHPTSSAKSNKAGQVQACRARGKMEAIVKAIQQFGDDHIRHRALGCLERGREVVQEVSGGDIVGVCCVGTAAEGAATEYAGDFSAD